MYILIKKFIPILIFISNFPKLYSLSNEVTQILLLLFNCALHFPKERFSIYNHIISLTSLNFLKYCTHYSACFNQFALSTVLLFAYFTQFVLYIAQFTQFFDILHHYFALSTQFILHSFICTFHSICFKYDENSRFI